MFVTPIAHVKNELGGQALTAVFYEVGWLNIVDEDKVNKFRRSNWDTEIQISWMISAWKVELDMTKFQSWTFFST